MGEGVTPPTIRCGSPPSAPVAAMQSAQADFAPCCRDFSRQARVAAILPPLRERSPAILPAGLRPSGHDRLRKGGPHPPAPSPINGRGGDSADDSERIPAGRSESGVQPAEAGFQPFEQVVSTTCDRLRVSALRVTIACAGRGEFSASPPFSAAPRETQFLQDRAGPSAARAPTSGKGPAPQAGPAPVSGAAGRIFEAM
jgi:hypothetical protein